MYTLSHPQAMWEPVDRSDRVAVHPLEQPRIGSACGFVTVYRSSRMPSNPLMPSGYSVKARMGSAPYPPPSAVALATR